MNDTQFQIDHLIELAVLQRAELKQLVDSMPQLRDHLSEEIERNLEEAEPAIRSELEQLVIARATDEHAKISVALTAKIDELAKALEITTAAKYSVLMAERVENANLLAKAEARIEDAASMLTHAVKEIVTDELSRFPRAGEIDQLRKEFAEPRGLNPRGRWMPDETYQRLDLVTINGDSFVSNIDGNRERPSRTAGDWTLSAARGNGGGGGGVTSMTDLVPVPSNGQLLIGNGSAFVNSTLTAGTGISISNGAGSITINATDGNITLDDGTAAAPSLNFTNEPTTGLFRASANVMGFAVNGVSRATMTTTGVTVTGTITPTGSVHAAAGSVGNPSLAFNADQDTGLFSIGANNIGAAVGGVKVLDVASTGLTVTGALGASSLTSPAATNLTLAGGTAGSDSVVVSNTLAASSAIIGAFKVGNGTAATNVAIGGGNINAGGSVTASGAISGAAGSFTTLSANSGGTAQIASLTNTALTTPVLFGSMADAATVGVMSFNNSRTSNTMQGIAGGAGGTTLYYLAPTGHKHSFSINFTEVAAFSSAGVTIASSTAGSANAGALVVTGGLSAGNNSNASYFGGAVTVAGTLLVTGANGRLTFDTVAEPSANGQLGYSATLGIYLLPKGGSTSDWTLYNKNGSIVQDIPTGTTLSKFYGGAYISWTGASSSLTVNRTDGSGVVNFNQSNGVPGAQIGTDGTGALSIYTNLSGSSVLALAITSAGAATFAGAVTVGGNVGFYNNAPVAKPTGVAVTAAAIHAALVTLNLIAA